MKSWINGLGDLILTGTQYSKWSRESVWSESNPKTYFAEI
jgi:hypothetical protein